jgi:uncharacterized membrane protein YvbJ
MALGAISTCRDANLKAAAGEHPSNRIDARARSSSGKPRNERLAVSSFNTKEISMKTPVAVAIGIVLFILVGIASFYLSQASNAPEGELPGMEAPDPGPE